MKRDRKTVRGGNMKRRIVAVVLATVLGAVCITGCGNTQETVESTAQVSTEAQTTLPRIANCLKSFTNFIFIFYQISIIKIFQNFKNSENINKTNIQIIHNIVYKPLILN